jgi:hypothetical protein
MKLIVAYSGQVFPFPKLTTNVQLAVAVRLPEAGKPPALLG